MDPLKKTNKDVLKSTYIDALFASTGWSYTGVETAKPTIVVEEVSPEKKHILDSLKDFAHKEAKENKFQFDGGEIRLKPPIKETKSVQELLDVWQELVTPICVQYGVSSELVHETKATPIRVLFLGDFPKGASDLSFQGDVRDLLLKMITAMKLKPEEFALSTIVKHHKVPDGKMKELGRESLPLVLHEIHYYRPQIVVTLGAFATSVILGTEDRLSSIHGEYFERETVSDLGTKHAYQIMPIFHPEFLLINPNMKKTTWTDLQKAMKILGLL